MAWQRVVNKIFRIRLMEKGLAFLGKTVQNILDIVLDVTTQGFKNRDIRYRAGYFGCQN